MNIDFTNKKTIALLSAVGILAVATIAAVVILLTLPGKAIQVEDFSGKTCLLYTSSRRWRQIRSIYMMDLLTVRSISALPSIWRR